MDTAQWPQEIVVKPIEEIVVGTNTSSCHQSKPPSSNNLASENNNNNNTIKKPRPQKEQALNCPRCHSTNTKFCYYNNYSLTQPRYFCKTCRRYWTEGGSLRNIPVGGGSRKNKRSSTSISSSPSPPSPNKNIKLIGKVVHEGQDLNLAFPSDLVVHQQNNNNNNNTLSSSSSSSTITSTVTTTTTTTPPSSTTQFSAMELLTGITSANSRGGLGLNSFLPHHPPDPNTVLYNNSTFALQDFNKTAGLNFSLDGIGIGIVGSGFAGLHHHQQDQTSGGGNNNGRLLFPFEDLNQVSNADAIDHQSNSKVHQQGDSSGYWSGMLGGGSW
ncbi:hypothetical protein HN51_028364 [Arachis hypogaea]|uniref:Dof zinc finger protein n=1 Tax=Arachis hypogaea TaxID=3818 RepID=A0A445BJ62_ARAHY|nr:dof zinc finger protein DOF4.6 isoform X1 [Arachis hypogaea]QHO34865.1 Dof zinc finger protein [Arachis hypogaea]RYR38699.1 hypothetical protein Ahy_A09g043851 isoform A [Arachis hypogaea]RYR38700.1 hypothetical protein Ahy_A09g043851 isoform B [Arachis hypogaea]